MQSGFAKAWRWFLRARFHSSMMVLVQYLQTYFNLQDKIFIYITMAHCSWTSNKLKTFESKVTFLFYHSCSFGHDVFFMLSFIFLTLFFCQLFFIEFGVFVTSCEFTEFFAKLKFWNFVIFVESLINNWN